VPGDYADLQQAIDAGNASICLGSGKFEGSFRVPIGGKVKITGQGATKTSVDAILVIYAGLELSRVTVTQGVVLQKPQDSRIHHARLRAGGDGHWDWDASQRYSAQLYTYGAAVFVGDDYGSVRGGGLVEISECDIARGDYYGYPYQRSGAVIVDNARARIVDNVVHDSPNGITVESHGSDRIEITRNTIRDTGDLPYGVGLGLNLGGSTEVTYDANAIRNNRVGVHLTLGGGQPTVAHQRNSSSGNDSNYGGVAKPD
jgi:hypothetical protein